MSRMPKVSFWIASAVLVSACASGGSASPDASSPTPTIEAPAPASSTGGDGFFSEAQVERGADVFSSVCSECHYVNEMSDGNFRFAWRRQTVGDLFELVSETMPDSSPGSLEPNQYADVVAYILSLNDFEPGSVDMPADSEALEAHSLARLSN